MRRFIGYRPEPPADYIERGTAAPPDQPLPDEVELPGEEEP